MKIHGVVNRRSLASVSRADERKPLIAGGRRQASEHRKDTQRLKLLAVFNRKWRLFISIAMTESSLNLICLVYQARTTNKHAHVTIWEDLMPHFYFNLVSSDNNIPDPAGKELVSLSVAYAHARTLIDKILFHVGHDDAAAWKVVISNDDDDAQMIVPFPVSPLFRSQRGGPG
jgi:hypothetical protein